MKKIIATIALTVTLCSIGTQAFSGSFYSTPRYGGGYNYYGDNWSGYSTPRYGGGLNFYSWDW